MMILGIDPGTACGWAVYNNVGANFATERRLASGVWDLKGGRFEGGGMRFLRLDGYVQEVVAAYKIEAIAYEEVRRHIGTDAAQIYGGIVAVITRHGEAQQVPYLGIPVGTIKKRATGKGNASKEMMVGAANSTFAPHRVADDNEADALWCAVVLGDQLKSKAVG